MRRNLQLHVLPALLMLLGLGAVFGGGALIISPSGSIFGMPLSMLQYSPFKTFLVPGIILFGILGIIPIGLTLALLKRPENKLAELFNFYRDMYWGWTYSIYTAFALIIWIQIEMVFLRTVHWSHTLYMFFAIAIAILFVAILPQVRDLYKKQAAL